MNQNNTSWFELNTHQPEKAMSFYAKTLGWEFESTDLPQGGAYWLARHNDQPVGGVFDLGEISQDDEDDDQSIPSHWMTYMQVTDISKAESLARVAGGEVTRPAHFLAGIGKLSVITDSNGALVGLIEADCKADIT